MWRRNETVAFHSEKYSCKSYGACRLYSSIPPLRRIFLKKTHDRDLYRGLALANPIRRCDSPQYQKIRLRGDKSFNEAMVTEY